MKLNHIGIAVNSLKEGGEFYSALGLEMDHVEEVPTEQVRVGFLKTESGVNLELLEATSPTSPIAKFIEKRGLGIHHICFEVKDLRKTLAALKSKGVRLINDEPRPGAHGCKVAFVHPSGAGGVLVELSESPKSGEIKE